MSSTIDYDVFGHCVICHKNMLIEQIIDGKPQKRFTPEYTEKEFLLNDGSRMRVAMCREHASNITEKDYKNIMKIVFNGWSRETKELVDSPLFPNWDEPKRQEYLERYKDKSIEASIDRVNNNSKDRGKK